VWLLVDKSHRGIPDYVVLIRAQHVQVCVLSVEVKEGQPAVMPGHIHSQVNLEMNKYFLNSIITSVELFIINIQSGGWYASGNAGSHPL
jgi:hypothetical protein